VSRHPSSRPTPRHGRAAPDDQGAALILSLVLIGVVSVVVVSLLGLVLANLRSSKVSEQRTDQRYAADAAIEQTIERVRNDRSMCGAASSPRTLPTMVVDGITVELSCQSTAGVAPGAAGLAIVTTSTAEAGITVAGPAPVTVTGPVHAARLADTTPMTVDGGSVQERRSATSCANDSDRPAGLVVQPAPPYRYQCTDAAAPTVGHALPTVVPPAAPAPTTVGPCKVFRPGTYTSAPALAPHNLFISGTYYFHDVGRLLVQDATVIGGERPDEIRINAGSSPCEVVPDDADAAGTGVKWLFGGTSWLDIGTSANIELFARQGNPASEGQSGISLQAVSAPAPTGMTASSRSGTGTSTPLVLVSGGSTGQLAIHGLLYAPMSFVSFFATSSSQAQLRGGVVVEHLHLASGPGSTALVVSP
jgi:hypothetical protein